MEVVVVVAGKEAEVHQDKVVVAVAVAVVGRPEEANPVPARVEKTAAGAVEAASLIQAEVAVVVANCSQLAVEEEVRQHPEASSWKEAEGDAAAAAAAYCYCIQSAEVPDIVEAVAVLWVLLLPVGAEQSPVAPTSVSLCWCQYNTRFPSHRPLPLSNLPATAARRDR